MPTRVSQSVRELKELGRNLYAAMRSDFGLTLTLQRFRSTISSPSPHGIKPIRMTQP